jgi:hypothetical protein
VKGDIDMLATQHFSTDGTTNGAALVAMTGLAAAGELAALDVQSEAALPDGGVQAIGARADKPYTTEGSACCRAPEGVYSTID